MKCYSTGCPRVDCSNAQFQALYNRYANSVVQSDCWHTAFLIITNIIQNDSLPQQLIGSKKPMTVCMMFPFYPAEQLNETCLKAWQCQLLLGDSQLRHSLYKQGFSSWTWTLSDASWWKTITLSIPLKTNLASLSFQVEFYTSTCMLFLVEWICNESLKRISIYSVAWPLKGW